MTIVVPYYIRNVEEMYAKDKYGNEIYTTRTFLVNAHGVQKYAHDKNGHEYLPSNVVDGEKQFHFTYDSFGKPIYPKNKIKEEYYPIDGYDRVLERRNGVWRYARDTKRREVYPKDESLNEYVYKKTLIVENGVPRLPQNRNGEPIYPKDSKTKDEYYVFNKETGRFIILTNSFQDEYYAKTLGGDDIYPPNDQIAKSADGTPLYALTKDGKVIYPTIGGLKRYLVNSLDKSELIYTKRENKLIEITAYLQNIQGGEVYPKVTVAFSGKIPLRSEIILGYKYAVDKNKQPFYPLDETGNEYTLDPNYSTLREFLLAVGYPITNDCLVIVPGYNNRPVIDPILHPSITKESVVGTLYRTQKKYVDYITRIKSVRTSRSPRIRYITRSISDPVPNSREASRKGIVPILHSNSNPSGKGSGSMWYYIIALALTLLAIPLAWFITKKYNLINY